MGKCKFKPAWLEKVDSNGHKVGDWGKQHSDSELFCNVCGKTINFGSTGFQSISQHYSKKKHKDECRLKLSSNQERLVLLSDPNITKDTIKTTPGSGDPIPVGTVKLFNIRDRTTAAELIWCLKCVASDYSFSSCNGLSETFQAMFGQDIVQDFSLGNNKAHYLITDALGPYFRDKQNKDMEGTFYSLVYDETTNAAGKKELQIGVRYWSHSFGRVVYRHLETFFIGHATAQVIADKINEAIIHASLPFTNLIILGSDSPNVNKSVNKIINDQMIIERNKGILNIGYCNIHTIHNGFLKGLQELGDDVSELVFSIHRFFNDWPSRWEDFSDIQKKCSLPKHHFLKHCSSRWLTLEPSAKRVLEQWPAILKYFLEFVPKHKQDLMKRPGYNKIVRLLKKSTIKAEIHFIISSAHVFTSVTGFFQKEEPMIHLLYPILSSLLQKIVSRICKPNAIKLLEENLAQDDFFISKNFLDLKDIVLSDEISDALKNVNDKDKNYFLLQVRKHYIAAAKYVIQKSSMSSPLLKSLSFLHPDKRTSLESCQHIVEIARAMPFSIPIDLICDEWKCIQIESEEPKSKEKAIDEYWSQYLKMTNLSGESKFPNISKVIKAALSITHGNADVERGFSASGRTLGTGHQ